MKPYYKGRYNSIKITKTKRNIICPNSEFKQYPYQSIGFKLGDPFAISYKIYISPKTSFVMDYGRVASGLYNNFHKNNFNKKLNPDTLSSGGSVIYFNQKALKDDVFQVKFLYNAPVGKLRTLKWYVGGGLQYRWHDIEYNYIYQSSTFQSELRKLNLGDYTYGPAVITGLEFSHPDIPLSSFFEIETYIDARAYPGWTRVSGGVGLRYKF